MESLDGLATALLAGAGQRRSAADLEAREALDWDAETPDAAAAAEQGTPRRQGAAPGAAAGPVEGEEGAAGDDCDVVGVLFAEAEEGGEAPAAAPWAIGEAAPLAYADDAALMGVVVEADAQEAEQGQEQQPGADTAMAGVEQLP